MSRNINLVVYVTNTSDSMQWSEIIILNICTVSKYVIKSPWIWLWKRWSCLFSSRSKCFIVLKLPPSSWWLTSQGKMFWNGCSKKKSQKWRRISAIKPSEGAYLIAGLWRAPVQPIVSTTAHNSLAHHLTCEVLKASRHTITTPEYSRWIMTTSLDSFRYSQVILTEASKPKHGIRCSSCSEVLIFVKRSRQRCFMRIQSVRADRCITETFGFTLSRRSYITTPLLKTSAAADRKHQKQLS